MGRTFCRHLQMETVSGKLSLPSLTSLPGPISRSTSSNIRFSITPLLRETIYTAHLFLLDSFLRPTVLVLGHTSLTLLRCFIISFIAFPLHLFSSFGTLFFDSLATVQVFCPHSRLPFHCSLNNMVVSFIGVFILMESPPPLYILHFIMWSSCALYPTGSWIRSLSHTFLCLLQPYLHRSILYCHRFSRSFPIPSFSHLKRQSCTRHEEINHVEFLATISVYD